MNRKDKIEKLKSNPEAWLLLQANFKLRKYIRQLRYNPLIGFQAAESFRVSDDGLEKFVSEAIDNMYPDDPTNVSMGFMSRKTGS